MKPFTHVTVTCTGPAPRYVLMDDAANPVVSLYAADPRGKERAEWLAAVINGTPSEALVTIRHAFESLQEVAAGAVLAEDDIEAVNAAELALVALEVGAPSPGEVELAALLTKALEHVESYANNGEVDSARKEAEALAHAMRNAIQSHNARVYLSANPTDPI
jgi:hypothetical protein